MGTLDKWMRQARIEAGEQSGQTSSESAELRELRKRNRLLEQEVEVLRRATAYLSQAHLPKRLYPLVSELAADGIPVVVSCWVLTLARQPYYRWSKTPVTSRDLDEAYRANALFDAHRDDPEFGYRLLADEACDGSEPMSDRTAWRIASVNDWWSVFGKKLSKNGKKPGLAVHDDLCVVIDERGRERHQFTDSRPNQPWLTDITEHKTSEGRLYLCAVKDTFSGRIVGYSIDSRMEASLAVRAARTAVRMRGDVNGCIVHPDRGSQFRSRKLRRELSAHNFVGSMGRVASCGDNAAMESFFSLRCRRTF